MNLKFSQVLKNLWRCRITVPGKVSKEKVERNRGNGRDGEGEMRRKRCEERGDEGEKGKVGRKRWEKEMGKKRWRGRGGRKRWV